MYLMYSAFIRLLCILADILTAYYMFIQFL